MAAAVTFSMLQFQAAQKDKKLKVLFYILYDCHIETQQISMVL